MTTARESIKIGNGAGFWGDNLDAPVKLVEDGNLDVLTLEYLAELTMAILAHLRSKDSTAGFVSDFPELIPRLVPHLKASNGPTIVTNAGGLNPEACARRVSKNLVDAGLGDWPVGVVSGDDLLSWIRTWIDEGIFFENMETGKPIIEIIDKLVCANAYLGAAPIVDALTGGARIVITGRVADASLTVGPAMARFGWRWDDWTKLAAASVAGHLIECGAQATGGLCHDWSRVPNLADIGYPVAELSAEGGCQITKPNGSGGMVTTSTIAEQLVYEIDDPACYRTPDVDVDLTGVQLSQTDVDRVRMTGAKGRAPGRNLKLSAVYRDGWGASGMVAVVGRDAEAKARAAGKIVLDRVKRAGFDLEKSLVEVIGAGDVAPGVVVPERPPYEVVLRVTVRDQRREAVERFCRELAPLITSGPPGIAGYAAGRPEARPAFGYWPALIPRELVAPVARVRAAKEWVK